MVAGEPHDPNSLRAEELQIKQLIETLQARLRRLQSTENTEATEVAPPGGAIQGRAARDAQGHPAQILVERFCNHCGKNREICACGFESDDWDFSSANKVNAYHCLWCGDYFADNDASYLRRGGRAAMLMHERDRTELLPTVGF